MSNDNGFNVGARRIGTFFLWAIPLVLGIAACVWLGFVIAGRDFYNQLSQEQRRAIYVGATTRPKSPLKIETPNTGPVKITRVDLDGSTASVYLENTSDTKTSGVEVLWTLVSPDGTLLTSGKCWINLCGGPQYLPPKAKAEVVLADYYAIGTDNRAVAVRFEVSANFY